MSIFLQYYSSHEFERIIRNCFNGSFTLIRSTQSPTKTYHLKYCPSSSYLFQVINRSRVRVRLTCPQKIAEYNYYGDEADDRNEKEAEIECVDGEFTMHNLTCETGKYFNVIDTFTKRAYSDYIVRPSFYLSIFLSI